MNMSYSGKDVLFGALALCFAFSSQAMAHGFDIWNQHGHNHKNDPKPECRTIEVGKTISGPANYHETYGKISKTLITIQNYYLRTEEGDVLKIATAPQQVDLQALAAFSQGLRLDLSNAQFPGGATEIHLAEIEVDVVKSAGAQIQSTDGTSCELSYLPAKLNLYTAAPITLMRDAYHVKVGYTALNSIQLKTVTTATKKECCTRKAHSHDRHCKWDRWGKHIDRDLGNNGRTCTLSEAEYSVVKTCKLVNRRQPVPSIPRAVDDDF